MGEIERREKEEAHVNHIALINGLTTAASAGQGKN